MFQQFPSARPKHTRMVHVMKMMFSFQTVTLHQIHIGIALNPTQLISTHLNQSLHICPGTSLFPMFAHDPSQYHHHPGMVTIMVTMAYHPHSHRPYSSPGAGSVPQEDLLQRRRRVQRVGGKHSGRGEEHQLFCNDLEFGIL